MYTHIEPDFVVLFRFLIYIKRHVFFLLKVTHSDTHDDTKKIIFFYCIKFCFLNLKKRHREKESRRKKYKTDVWM